MAFERDHNSEPCYVISIAARMVGLHAQTLRYYERAGLLSPSRSLGRQRLVFAFGRAEDSAASRR